MLPAFKVLTDEFLDEYTFKIELDTYTTTLLFVSSLIPNKTYVPAVGFGTLLNRK